MTRTKARRYRLGEAPLRPMEAAKPGPLPRNVGLARAFGGRALSREEHERRTSPYYLRAIRAWLSGVNPGERPDVLLWAYLQTVEGLDVPMAEVRRMLGVRN